MSGSTAAGPGPARASGEAPRDAARLFFGSCVALVATSVAFATVGAVMFDLKGEFLLSNAQVGWIAGVALGGFALSQLLFSPLCDTLGMRFLLRLAFVGHLAGSLAMVFAGGFGALYAGALVLAMANGLVEAACNPLVAALYPRDKTVKLNQFHVWFPGGIVLGGVAAYALDAAGLGWWQLKIGLILIPTLGYGVLLLGRRFPPTEGVRSGVSMRAMFKAALTTPLMLLMLGCMALTASVELGPNRWIPAVLEAGGMPGILVLVYINGLMAVLRYKAGPVVHRLSPTGILLASAVASGAGLLWLSAGGSAWSVFAAATVFAVGVCYFWPTMLGFVSERVPRGGALALGLMGAVGMAVVGWGTSPLMGKIADRHAHQELLEDAVVLTLAEARGALESQSLRTPGPEGEDLRFALAATTAVLASMDENGSLPPVATANALRAVISSGSTSPAVDRASALLGPAESHGGLVSFRYVVPLCGVLALVFGALHARDRTRRRSAPEPPRRSSAPPPYESFARRRPTAAVNPHLGRKLRYGMVGGGPGAFIGGVHRTAASLHGEWELVAGAFSSSSSRSREQGRALGLDPARVYDDYLQMAKAEGALPKDSRIDAVVVAAPNHLHHRVAKAFLDAEVHVVCDKPMTTTAADAEELGRAVERARLVLAVTYNYTGYPMVKEARRQVSDGRLGTLRKVVAEYSQGWLAKRLEESGHKQAAWRLDPAQAGPSSAMADIGSHAHNLIRYVTGLRVEQVFADVASLVPGRAMEDDAGALLRFAGGARGVLAVSQVCAGEENGLRLRVYGEAGGLDWRQERPNELRLLLPDAPAQRLTRGSPYLSAAARHAARLPPGHPEGFVEAFANIYRNAGRTIGAALAGTDPDPLDRDFPDHVDGLRGVRFVESVLRSAREERWTAVGPATRARHERERPP